MKIEEMRLEKRKVKDLKEYPGNPRKMDKTTLEKLMSGDYKQMGKIYGEKGGESKWRNLG